MIVRHFLLLLTVFLFLSVANIPVYSQTIVGEFGNYKITLDEFEYAYAKNVGGWEVAEEDSFSQYEDFMDLYMKFRMKLRNAQVRSFDTDPELQKELEDYKRQVGEAYIIEKYIIQPGVKDLYEQRKVELRVSHIMIRSNEDGDDAAFEKANAIIDSIKDGASFEEMAEKYSDDQFSGPKGGDIFYVTAGVLPYEFDNAMYTLQAGEVYPEPVKTNYGYHLIKITERHVRTPKVKASHILISYFDGKGEVDSAAAKLTADTVLIKLNEGESFESLVEQYSDDSATKVKDGDLGFIERRQMVQAFDEIAFNLNVGELSGLVQTNFGYHIIKLTDRQQYPSFESEKDDLKKIYQKQRYQADYDGYIDSLKSKYNYVLDETTVDLIIENCDSSSFGIDYPNPDAIAGKTLFTYAGNTISGQEFINETNNNSDFMNKSIFLKTEVMKAVNKLAEEKLIEHQAMNLQKEDPNYASLMDEYRNGVYIFKLQEDEVWNQLDIDSVKIYSYWEEHKEDFALTDRVAFGEIFSMKDSLIQKYYKWIQESADFDSLAALYTERPGKKKDKGRYDLQDVDFSDLSRKADTIKNAGDFTEPFPFSGGYAIFKLYQREPSRLKTFNESRAEVSGIVQEMESKRLENEYLDILNNIYNPAIFYDELHKAFKPTEQD
ncbi:MAG: peptidylprolyl isomerase [Bacteroidetes bacterium]|nr:peptidylprolyl isomerase [Bacteroidota bacterium]